MGNIFIPALCDDARKAEYAYFDYQMYKPIMLNVMKKLILLFICSLSMNLYGKDDMLCMGYHWTEDKANLMMKKFAASWDDLPSWEKRAEIIKKGIIEGMGLQNMPAITGGFCHPPFPGTAESVHRGASRSSGCPEGQ
jgi:hypothetical protein